MAQRIRIRLKAFDHGVLDPSDFGWLRVFADHAAVSIANARAFEEIQRLKAQLELQNAYLQEEVVEAKAFGDLVEILGGDSGRGGLLNFADVENLTGGAAADGSS